MVFITTCSHLGLYSSSCSSLSWDLISGCASSPLSQRSLQQEAPSWFFTWFHFWCYFPQIHAVVNCFVFVFVLFYFCFVLFCFQVYQHNLATILLHKVKSQYVHFNLHTKYFLLPWKFPNEISRRSPLFNNLRQYLPIYPYNFLPWDWIDLKLDIK